jgi:DNA (cytosine-5)-methyltransferase 1
MIQLYPGEIIVDSFAGGGGASLGIELALGRGPDIAINHDPEAIAMHTANHPHTRHFCESVWDVSPRKACAGRPVGLAWFSPDCKHFSKAKGGKPVDKTIRGLAWVVIRWARDVQPRIIIVENVEEFQSWGPLGPDNKPCPVQKGLTFRRWVGELKSLGYRVEYKELRACDFGAPTTRKRLFIVARRDGLPIVWPKPTHGPGTQNPYRTAAECIDWSIPCRSIFGRKKPLAENTLRRIARGIKRYVLESADPFIVRIGHTGHGDAGKVRDIEEPLSTITTKAEHCLIAPVLAELGHADRDGRERAPVDLHQPTGTIMAGGGKYALVSAFLAKHYGGVTGQELPAPIGTVTTVDHHSLVTSHLVKLRGSTVTHHQTAQDMRTPAPTITAGGLHLAEVRAFLIKYYGSDQDPVLTDPLHTITTKHRFGLVTVAGQDYQIADIGLRMLSPRELFTAQGFPLSYVTEIEYKGKPLSKAAQVRMCGNSVSPLAGAAIVRANVGATKDIGPSLQEWEPGMVKPGEQMAMFDLSQYKVTA